MWLLRSLLTLQVDSQHGNYVEGAIDLLPIHSGSKDALVVDYKTGDITPNAPVMSIITQANPMPTC